MRILKDLDILDNYNYVEKLIKIASLKNNITKKEISKEVNCHFTDSYFFTPLIRFLCENQFIEVDDSRVPHLIKIHRKKLFKFLKKSKLFKQAEIIIENTNFLGQAIY